MFKFEGKVGLVTGGASGIGAVIVKELLKAGLKGVAVLDISEDLGLQLVDQLNDEFGTGRAIFLNVDVSDRKQFDDAFISTINIFGGIDIVINNASSGTEIDWEKHIGVNLTGTVNGTILAFDRYLPKYKSDNEAVIVNMASLAGLYGYPATPVYAATKSGIIELTRSLGHDLHYNRTKIKVIAVCPGYTGTTLRGMNEKNFLGPQYYEILKETLTVDPVFQPPTAVSKGVIEIINKASSGSVWMIKESKPPYQVELLKRQ